MPEKICGSMSSGKKRKHNFSDDECRVLREMYSANREYLSSAFYNKVKNTGKQKIWESIEDNINSLGVESGTTKEIKHKWKNLFQKQMYNTNLNISN